MSRAMAGITVVEELGLELFGVSLIRLLISFAKEFVACPCSMNASLS